MVTPDTIVIKSPGSPVKPITLEMLQSFKAPMLSRNPTLHYVFGRLELTEEHGLGLKSMREDATRAGLPLPKYSWEDPYLVLTLYRSAVSAVHDLSPKTASRLNKDEKASWQFIAGRESITRSELMAQMGFDERKAQRILKGLREAGLLSPIGKGRVTSYKVVRL
jgi:ATP-dependent DNA helicase RecG